ncbi:MAG: energy-coupling factor transporter ATPase [Clostridia bacterium]|nr:energy-coupling factor transporter ATPase [Clostridia bacterium]
MESIIKTEKLSFVYDSREEGIPGRVIIDGLDLEIAKGSFVALLGRNGSGKSTLVKHFNAVHLPSGGCCYVSGMDTADDGLLYEIRRRVGMVFQNPDNQIVASVVDEDVAFAPENLGLEREEIVKRVDDALAAVGMTAFKNHAPHLLSGGQKQRIAIAGVIAMRPECIVLDEPTAMLDPSGRREVMETVKRLREEYDLTVVMITHHMSEAAQADRVIVLDKGSIYLDGTPSEVFSDPERLSQIGLTVPNATLLLYNLRKLGADVPLDAFGDERCANAIYDWLNEK